MKNLLVAAVSGCLFSSTLLGAGIINPSFENPVGGIYDSYVWDWVPQGNEPSGFGWVVEGEIDILGLGTVFPAGSDGLQFIDLNGYVPGAVYQDITFAQAGSWEMSFDMSANPDQGGVKTMQVEFGVPGAMVVLNNYTVDSAGMGWGFLDWSTFTTPAVTVDTATTYRLQFTSVTTDLPESGPLLDNVQLTLVPEPTTFTLLGLGSLVLFMARRRIQFQSSEPKNRKSQ